MNHKKHRWHLYGTAAAFVVLGGLLGGIALSGYGHREVTIPTDTDTVRSEAAAVSAVESETADREWMVISEEPLVDDSEAERLAAEEAARVQAEREKLGVPEGLSTYMETSMGTMLFYAQADPRWGDYLWGGEDRLDVYGCGPVVMAMIANAFGTQGNVTPIEMADWCDANGQRSSRSGALHSIVTTSLTAYGLKVESMSDRLNAESMCELLKSGHVFVALVGPGHFTNGGHFIMIRGINEDGTINVADPAGLEHNTMTYTPEFLLGELKLSASDAGGPLWCISKAE